MKHKDKIFLLKSEKNSGPYVCKNIVIDASSGEYITILDSDDMFHKNKLYEQVNILDNKKMLFW